MAQGKILIVDDEKDIRALMQEIFEEEGYQIATAANGQQALEACHQQAPDIIFLDIWMPDIDGITLLKKMTELNLLERTCVIIISGHASIDTAIEATKLGAYDFFEKPLSLAKLLITAERAMSHLQLHTENRQLKQKQPIQILPVGKSKLAVSLRETIERLAKYSMPILIIGEPGAGKHHFAQAVHKLSERQNKPFIEIDCRKFQAHFAQLTRPDANQSAFYRQFLQADGGTLLLAHLEALPAEGQDFILSLIKQGQYLCPTNQQMLKTNLRIIGLSQGNCDSRVQTGDFNPELYQRLSTIRVDIPALRQRTEDIPELIHYFIDYFLIHDGLQYRNFTLPAQNILRQYSWPGNFRELQNLIQRLLILGEGDVCDQEAKQAIEAAQSNISIGMDHIDVTLNLKDAKTQFERAYFKRLLIETGGNVSETAKRSGLERTHLYRKLKTLDLDPKNPK